MKRFKWQNHVLYFAEDHEAPIHYVPNGNWFEYLEHRFNVPDLCVIFDRVEDAEYAASTDPFDT